MERFTGIIGIVIILGLAFLWSNNRKAINYRLVLTGLGLQIALAVFILKVPLGQEIFYWLFPTTAHYSYLVILLK
jgi:CNT family concentrative nucleoside transporter